MVRSRVLSSTSVNLSLSSAVTWFSAKRLYTVFLEVPSSLAILLHDIPKDRYARISEIHALGSLSRPLLLPKRPTSLLSAPAIPPGRSGGLLGKRNRVAKRSTSPPVVLPGRSMSGHSDSVTHPHVHKAGPSGSAWIGALHMSAELYFFLFFFSAS